MQIESMRLSGLKKITPRLFRDERGFFKEHYRTSLYEQEGLPPFVQDNLSFSLQGTIRALHFQGAPGQAKLVSCLKGRIWDVAVDVREGSPTFGEWEAVELSEEGGEQLYLPVGFAHGFLALEEALVLYKVSTYYDPAEERSIRWNDPDLKIDWPVEAPLLSKRDRESPFFREVFRCLCG